MTVTEFFNKLNNGTTWSAGVAFKRAAPLPLDRYSVFASKAEAETYASENAVAYCGQIIAVVEENATGIYYIDHAMTLQEVGKLPTGDGKTISIDDNGIISLYGLDGELEEAKSYQPVYKNGELTWVELSATTVEGLAAEIEKKADKADTLAGYGITDAYTKTEVADLVASAGHLKRQIVTELPEVSAANADTIYMMKVDGVEGDAYKEYMLIDGAIVQIGDTSVNLENYVEKNGTDRLITEEEGTLLDKLGDGEYNNFVKSVDTEELAVDGEGKLTIVKVGNAKVDGLAELLEGKVDKVEGSRLITEKEAEKLEKLIIGEDGSVEVSGTIAAGNVDGLAEWITARAGSLEGLSENNFSDALLEKLNGIEADAQENVIEAINVNGKAVAITNKTANINVPVGTDAENGVTVNEDKTMTVNSLNVNKLTQTEGETLILNGGSSAN